MFLVIGFLVIRDATMLNDLKKEVSELNKLDFTKDRYNTKIKTSGNYALVEESVKTYLDEYAVLLQDVLSVMKDPQLTKILSYDNYSKDGPNFTNSLKYLKESKSSFNTKVDTLITKSEETSIINYANDRISDPYYAGLYKELMLDEEMKAKFDETKDLLYKTKIRINSIYDTREEVLNFLVKNKDQWKIEEKQIKFKTEGLYNQYNSLISKVNNNEKNA